MWEKVVSFFETYGVKILTGILILVVGIILIKITLLVFKKVFDRTKLEKATAKFLRTCVKVLLWVLLFMVFSQYVGIPMTGFVAIISAAGLAISLALQGSLSNLANGVVIISTKPFKEGDYVSIGSVEGNVKEIKMLHTILQTTDNKEISIPNQTVVSSEIINYNRHKTRKLLIEFAVSYSTDIPKAKKLLADIMLNNDYVLLEPLPVVQMTNMADSSIILRIACWVATDKYWDLKFQLIETVFNEFKKEKIDIPYNQMEIRLRNDQVILPYDNTPLKKRSENALIRIEEKEEEDKLIEYIKKGFNKKRKTSKAKIQKTDKKSNDNK